MSKLTSFDKTKIWYEYEKKSEVVLVFIHGWAQNWTSWEKEIVHFSNLGYSTLALDLRGHGQSDKPDEREAYVLDFFAKDLKCIFEMEKIKQFVLIGHSMGGMVALSYIDLDEDARSKSRCVGLILCDTTGQTILSHSVGETYSPFLKHVLDYIFSHSQIRHEYFSHLPNSRLSQSAKTSDIELFLRGLRNTPMKSVIACLEAMLDYDVRDKLLHLQIPTLVIHGENDIILPKIHSLELSSLLTKSDLAVIPNGNHSVQISHEKEVEEQINIFLHKNGL